jgi:hypothetical protein
VFVAVFVARHRGESVSGGRPPAVMTAQPIEFSLEIITFLHLSTSSSRVNSLPWPLTGPCCAHTGYCVGLLGEETWAGQRLDRSASGGTRGGRRALRGGLIGAWG